LLFCFATAAAVFLLSPMPAQAGSEVTADPDDAINLDEAADYCVQKGGEVDVRYPYFNTNDNQSAWLRLSGARRFCKFTLKKDGSRIHILLATLVSEKPTLAALAYYAQVPYDGTTCHGNPGSCYCSQLGGTDLFGGVNLNGGGWVKKADPVDTSLEACIFPDMSTIDSWGLTYHQAGIIRGKNLEKVLKYPNPYSNTKKK
jgi:putative hemolysin